MSHAFYSINDFPIVPPVYGHECCSLHVCLPMVYSVIFRKVIITIAYTFHCSFFNYYRWDMSVDEKVYTEDKARTLQKMQELSSHSYSLCARHVGCVLPPLVHISLDRIVLDELHLLQIMDVLIRNLIHYADSQDHHQKTHHGVESHNLRKLEQTIRSCGVYFQIWQNKEPTGKPIPGSFDWTPLSGKHKLQVLKNLPEKMDTILDKRISPSVARLWNVSE